MANEKSSQKLPQYNELREEIEKTISSLPCSVLDKEDFLPYTNWLDQYQCEAQSIWSLFPFSQNSIQTNYLVPQIGLNGTGSSPIYPAEQLEKIKKLPKLADHFLSLDVFHHWFSNFEIGRSSANNFQNQFPATGVYATVRSSARNAARLFWYKVNQLGLVARRNEVELAKHIENTLDRFPGQEIYLFAGTEMCRYLHSWGHTTQYKRCKLYCTGDSTSGSNNHRGPTGWESTVLVKSQVRLKFEIEYDWYLERVPRKYDFGFAMVSKMYVDISPDHIISAPPKNDTIKSRLKDLE